MANALKAKIEELKVSFARMSTRERVMVSALGGVVIFLIVAGIGYYIWSSLDDLRVRNGDMRQALADLNKYRGKFVEMQQRRDQIKRAIPETALELTTYVDKAAQAVGVKIDESTEVQGTKGSQYLQKGLQIKLRKLSLPQLVALLKELESSTTHIVQVTELSLLTRWQKHEEIDAEIVVSTYERSTEKTTKKKKRRT